MCLSPLGLAEIAYLLVSWVILFCFGLSLLFLRVPKHSTKAREKNQI